VCTRSAGARAGTHGEVRGGRRLVIEGLHSHRHSIPALCHESLWWCVAGTEVLRRAARPAKVRQQGKGMYFGTRRACVLPDEVSREGHRRWPNLSPGDGRRCRLNECWGPGLPETRQAGRRCAEKRQSGEDRPLQPLEVQLEAGQLDCRRDGSWAIHPKVVVTELGTGYIDGSDLIA
jgi:hypothetical protein